MIKKSYKFLFQGKAPTPKFPWVEGPNPRWSSVTLGGSLDLSQNQIQDLFGYEINFSNSFNFHNNLHIVANRVINNETLPFIKGKINSKKLRLYMTEQTTALDCPLFDYIYRKLNNEQFDLDPTDFKSLLSLRGFDTTMRNFVLKLYHHS